MRISSELIKELQKRIDVSYEEAEIYLKKARGDIDYAEYLIKKKRNSSWGHTRNEGRRLFEDMLIYRMIITRKDEVLINLPVLIVVVFFLIVSSNLFLVILIFAVGFLTECELKIQKTGKKREEEDNIVYKYEKEYNSNKAQNTEVKGESKLNNKDNNKNDIKYNNADIEVEIKEELKEVTKETNKGIKEGIKEQPKTRIQKEQKIDNSIVDKSNTNVSENDNDDDYYEIIIEE